MFLFEHTITKNHNTIKPNINSIVRLMHTTYDVTNIDSATLHYINRVCYITTAQPNFVIGVVMYG
jgi:hypothetical protein